MEKLLPVNILIIFFIINFNHIFISASSSVSQSISTSTTIKPPTASSITSTQKIPSTSIKTTQKIPSSSIKTTQKIPSSSIKTTQKIPSSSIKTTQKIPSSSIKSTQKIPSTTQKFQRYPTYYMNENCGKTQYIEEGSAIIIEFPWKLSLPEFYTCQFVVQHSSFLTGYLLLVSLKYRNVNCFDAKFTIGSPFEDCGPSMNIPNEDRIKYDKLSSVKTNLKTSYATKAAFTAIVTSYRDGGIYGCGPGEFRCWNDHCIRKEFECDGHNNCGDRSDEYNCGFIFSKGGIAGITVGVLIVVCVVSIILCLQYRRRIHHHNYIAH